MRYVTNLEKRLTNVLTTIEIYLMIFLMAIVTISVFGYLGIWAYDNLTSKGYTNIEFHIHDPFLSDIDGSHVYLY